jgi:hypothetical protein
MMRASEEVVLKVQKIQMQLQQQLLDIDEPRALLV